MKRILPLVFAFFLPWGQGVQIAAAEVTPPVFVEHSLARDYGYFIGDLVKISYRISMPPDFHLKEDSLPGAGDEVGEGVEIRERKIRSSATGDARIFTLEMTYQVFATTDVARNMEIPDIHFSCGQREAPASLSMALPSIPITISPLASSGDPFRPPISWSWASSSSRIISSAGASLLLGGFGLAAFMFRKVRRPSPFGQGLKRLSGEKDPGTALIVFRTALNEKAGKAIFPNNMEELLRVFPEAGAHVEELLRLMLISDEVSFNPESAALDDGLLTNISKMMRKMKRLETWA